MRVRSAGASDTGRHRPHNEDSYLCDDALGLYIVADGVGGRAKGEIASAEAVDTIHNWVLGARHQLDALTQSPRSDLLLQKVRRTLEASLQSACYIVYGMGEQDPERKGMSTTTSALLITAGLAFIAQVGDSRVYHLRKGHAAQLTEDHTLINYKLKHGLMTPEEAKHAPGKNVITRAVGHRDYVQVDVLHLELELGDRFLLCSDGLHGYLKSENELLPILSNGPLERGVKDLIDMANRRGGKDNITAVAVEIV
jgi:protein phosphatase